MKKFLQFLILITVLTACSSQAPAVPTATPLVLPGTSTPLPPPTATPKKSQPAISAAAQPTTLPPLATATAYDRVKINSVGYLDSDCAKTGSLYVVALGSAGPAVSGCLPIETTKYGAVKVWVDFVKDESDGENEKALYLLDKGEFNWMNSSSLFQMELPAGNYTANGSCDDICEISIYSTNGYKIAYFEVESVGDFSFNFDVKYDFTKETTMAEVLIEQTDNGGASFYDLIISPVGNLVTTP